MTDNGVSDSWQPEYGIYLHVPFCRHRCHYCDFNTYTWNPERGERDPLFSGASDPVETYLEALQREIRHYQGRLPRPAVSVFIGGGTPSLLNGDQMTRLFSAIDRLPRIHGAELTMEVNPGTLTADRWKALEAGPVNRLSIGMQAWQDHHLQRLGRIHRQQAVGETVEAARRCGFSNLSLDLMFGLPAQTLDEWKETVEAAVALEPEHLSAYSLILEPDTPFERWFHQGLLSVPGEDLTADMYAWARGYLARTGYHQYEISNFARRGAESRHNRLYWQNAYWLGLGPGAHGRLPGFRYRNVASPRVYARRLAAGHRPVAQQQAVSRREAMEETFMLGLRLADGVAIQAFEERFGLAAAQVFARPLERLLRQELIECESGRIRLTHDAFPVANEVFAAFI